MKREEGVTVDAHAFSHTEQSEFVVTICIEQRRGDTRLDHNDFYLTLDEALTLKKSIDELQLEQRHEIV